MENTTRNQKEQSENAKVDLTKSKLDKEEHKKRVTVVNRHTTALLSNFGKKIRQISPLSHNVIEDKNILNRKSELLSETSPKFRIDTYMLKIFTHLEALHIFLDLRRILVYIIMAIKQCGKLYISLTAMEDGEEKELFKHLVLRPKDSASFHDMMQLEEQKAAIRRNYQTKKEEEKSQAKAKDKRIKELEILLKQETWIVNEEKNKLKAYKEEASQMKRELKKKIRELKKENTKQRIEIKKQDVQMTKLKTEKSSIIQKIPPKR